jgi:hypothetical protein
MATTLHDAYLMVLVDIEEATPTLKGWSILSSNNPTVNLRTQRWLEVFHLQNAGGFEDAKYAIEGVVTNAAGVSMGFEWITKLPRLG